MSIEAISAIDIPSVSALSSTLKTGAQDAPMAAFQPLLDAFNSVNGQLQAAQNSVQSLATGHTDNLHRVMMDMEQTRLSFELLMQVRNKVMEAYQELMRMQV